MSTHYPPNWQYRLNKLLAVPTTTQNGRVWSAWAAAEGGSSDWNPLNTTYPLPFGESNPYNGSDVQNYWKPVAGICAVALTLIQADYLPIIGDLQAAKYTAEEVVTRNRAAIQKWGTNPDTMLQLLKNIQ